MFFIVKKSEDYTLNQGKYTDVRKCLKVEIVNSFLAFVIQARRLLKALLCPVELSLALFATLNRPLLTTVGGQTAKVKLEKMQCCQIPNCNMELKIQ